MPRIMLGAIIVAHIPYSCCRAYLQFGLAKRLRGPARIAHHILGWPKRQGLSVRLPAEPMRWVLRGRWRLFLLRASSCHVVGISRQLPLAAQIAALAVCCLLGQRRSLDVDESMRHGNTNEREGESVYLQTQSCEGRQRWDNSTFLLQQTRVMLRLEQLRTAEYLMGNSKHTISSIIYSSTADVRRQVGPTTAPSAHVQTRKSL